METSKGEKMKILITGATGFIGKNLCAVLQQKGHELLRYDIESEPALLDTYTEYCEFVFHLAGINRPKESNEFRIGNYNFTEDLINKLKNKKNRSRIVMASSTQAALDNPYGRSKKAAEDILTEYATSTGVSVFIYRLTNVFGKWCKPNYNSVVATFCYNITRGLDITVNDPSAEVKLIYIDDVVSSLKNCLTQESTSDRHYSIEPVYTVTLGKLTDYLYGFRESRNERSLPDFSDSFIKKLYSTYLSYLPEDEFSYALKMNCDNRGSFTEFIRTPDRGQVSVNISKPGIIKGNHWHHTKVEKFLVVSGVGVIRFRKIDSTEIIEYHVSGEKLEVIDIPPGYTHNVENLGQTDMVTVMWVNEPFDPEKPDTFTLGV